MAIFNEINKRSGLVVGAVVLALVLFLLTDAFFGQNSLFSSSDNNVGEISGENISIQDYQQQMQLAEQNYMIQTNSSVTENDRQMIQENAWNQLVFNIAYQEEFEKLGLTVTDEEWLDLAKGDFIHPMVKQLFGNPENFQKEMVSSFLANLQNYPPQDQMLWNYVDTKLPEIRIREKYSNLLQKTSYVTSAEAKREYVAQNEKADIKFVNIPLFSIPDSAVQVSDAELRDHISKNEANYKVEAGRSLDYVVFSVQPSAQDSAEALQEIQALAVEFANAEDDSLYAQFNSDEPTPIAYSRIGDLPKDLQNQISGGNIDTSKVYGPFFQDNSYKIFKVLGSKQDTVASARASHILFKAEEGNSTARAEAKKKAQEVLSQIKSGANFEEMAREHGSDATAPQGGDLGWFTEGMMVKPFNDAVFNTNQAGLLPRLVETQFGYHIVKVTEPKTKRQYKVAEVNRTVDYTEETKERVYQQATNFANSVGDTSEFYDKAKEAKSLDINSAKNLRKNDRNLNNISNAREVIRWAYTEGEVGDISPVINIDDKFIVAIVTNSREEGVADLEDVRDEVTTKVQQEKKANQILAKVKEMNGTMEEIASNYGPSATTGKAEGVNLSANYVSGLGYDPIAVGRIFGLQPNQRSAPFSGQSSVIIMEVTALNPAPEIADYSSYKSQINQQRSSQVEYRINEAVKEASEIEDTRYKFF